MLLQPGEQPMPRTHLPNATIAAFCFAVAVTLPWTSQAFAQSDAAIDNQRFRPTQPPMLHLAATDSVQLIPDELVAFLSAIQISNTAIAAQRQVNALIRDATAELRRQPGIEFAVRDYSVFVTAEKPPRWTAQQSLAVRGRDSDALLELASRLQAKGLALGGLTWRSSSERVQRAYDQATILAVDSMRLRAEAAAKALGLAVDHFQDIRLDDENRVMPMARLATPNMAPAVVPPQSTPEPEQIVAHVASDVVLKPAS
jgi:uncharacterized protein YggE